jgi:hypothetical protein
LFEHSLFHLLQAAIDGNQAIKKHPTGQFEATKRDYTLSKGKINTHLINITKLMVK